MILAFAWHLLYIFLLKQAEIRMVLLKYSLRKISAASGLNTNLGLSGKFQTLFDLFGIIFSYILADQSK